MPNWRHNSIESATYLAPWTLFLVMQEQFSRAASSWHVFLNQDSGMFSQLKAGTKQIVHLDSCFNFGEALLREKAVETYLGRPWKTYSRIVFMRCFIADPMGYLPWNSSRLGLDTLFYGEYNNSGPGSDVTGRVKWPGFHVLDAAEADNFTVSRFSNGCPRQVFILRLFYDDGDGFGFLGVLRK